MLASLHTMVCEKGSVCVNDESACAALRSPSLLPSTTQHNISSIDVVNMADDVLLADIASDGNQLLSAAEYKQRGNELFAAGRYTEARLAYSNAIDSDTSDALFYLNRAACALKLAVDISIDDLVFPDDQLHHQQQQQQQEQQAHDDADHLQDDNDQEEEEEEEEEIDIEVQGDRIIQVQGNADHIDDDSGDDDGDDGDHDILSESQTTIERLIDERRNLLYNECVNDCLSFFQRTTSASISSLVATTPGANSGSAVDHKRWVILTLKAYWRLGCGM
jgi:hypothetical protein